ncbi:MAG: PTS glucitol/sorbitol transporter subunit IIA [Actinomycetota bacterium]|nr:PTS glucitol/sorbitol transporter subunit IIA [Actinomycetota bacterium]
MADEAQEHVRYDTKVTAVGEGSGEFFDAGIIVLFGQDAPEELQEFAVVHDPSVTEGGLEPGDVVHIGDERLQVLAVGDVADENLTNLGHIVLKRNGQQEASMPGDVCCDEGEVPEIGVGTPIRVVGS